MDNDPLWSVQWSTNNPSVSAVNGLIQAGNFSGEVIITALIYYNGALVGNTMQIIWVGAPKQPVLTVNGIRGNNVICEGEPIYLNASTDDGFLTYYTWTIYENLIDAIYREPTQNPYLYDPRLRRLSAGEYFVEVAACNECGCTQSVIEQITILNKDERCYSLTDDLGKIQINSIIENEIVIYPSPVSNQLTIKLPSIYTENPTQVELYNSIGQLVLSKSYTETNIELSVLSYPKGLYVLKIQNGKEMKTEKIIIE